MFKNDLPELYCFTNKFTSKLRPLLPQPWVIFSSEGTLYTCIMFCKSRVVNECRGCDVELVTL